VLGPLGDDAVDRLLEHCLERYVAGSTLFSDALPCLDRMAVHRIGIISNGHPAHQQAKLERCGIADRFECVLVSEACGVAKPDPAIFHQACARLGEPPASAIYVGDRYDVDAEGARRAGLRGVWLDRDRSADGQHAPPIVSSLDELDAVLS
jgi:putative hydrolase of the HAD superfamily